MWTVRVEADSQVTLSRLRPRFAIVLRRLKGSQQVMLDSLPYAFREMGRELELWVGICDRVQDQSGRDTKPAR